MDYHYSHPKILELWSHNYKITACITYVTDLVISSLPLSLTFRTNFFILIIDFKTARVERNKANQKSNGRK